MAIAGLHGVSVLESSFLRDSQSQTSRRRGDGRSGSARSSSLLQIWREIEDEHAVSQVQGRHGEVLLEQRSNESIVVDLSREDTPDRPELGQMHDLDDAVFGENESETWSQSQSHGDSHDGHEDLNNSSCENSSVFGEAERERVRQVFREWMNSGSRDRGSNISWRNSSPRREWLGETEQERVRVIREWVQTSSQQRSVSSGENREQPSAEIGSDIERVRDGFVNHSEVQNEHIRRGMRKLCGRQVMLDMIKRTECERQREIQELLDHQAVSRFPHRNRIQALLRGRFLRNDRCVDHNRSMSVAESELGLLRQRQTVSGLREGFFSRMDSTSCSQATSNLSDTSSNNDIYFNTNEQTGESSSCMVAEPNNRSGNRVTIAVAHCLGGTTSDSLYWQGSTAHAEGNQLWCLQIESPDRQSFSIECEGSYDTVQNVDVVAIRDTANELIQQSLQTDDSEHSNNQESSDVHNEQSEHGDISNGENNSPTHNDYTDGNVDDANYGSGAADQLEQIVANEGSGWHQSNTEWRNSTSESVDDNQLGNIANEWPESRWENEDGENRLPEASEVWPEDGGFQEAVENWLGEPSDHGTASGGRVHSFYFSDDDNVHSVELRELHSRRRVSNLLGSSFRESLNQLIQSYVERQGHANMELDPEEATPSTVLVEQDSEQQRRDQIVEQEGTNSSPLDMHSLPTPPTPPVWDQHPHGDNWPHNDDLEIINVLRLDMARLHQRMNTMQRMLEACMDMQLELQRSIRQEVSAALNRSAGSSVIHDSDSPGDNSKLEFVRNGLCCICCESNIDSLLYRCGHVCTCSRCANELLQSRRKCPMCQAPVVEVIRTYSIL